VAVVISTARDELLDLRVLGNWAEQSLYFKALTGFTLQHYFTYSYKILSDLLNDN
jgi:hypothetical protein